MKKNLIKMFDSYVNDNYLIGLPSGQIIDIHYKTINILKREGYIIYNHKLMSYIFKDENYIKILKFLKLPIPEEKNVINLDKIQEFFDKQKNIRSYYVNKDGIVVNGSIFVTGQDYYCFPFQFKSITGDFIFKNCKLKTLENGPLSVGGYFDVSHNNLMDLFDGPKYVGKTYDCSNNKLITLDGCPKILRGDFDCSNNKLESFIGGPDKVYGFIDCTNNKIKNDKGKPECSKIIISGTNKFIDEGEGKYRW